MKIQATSAGGIYEVQEFDDFTEIQDETCDFIYQLDSYFIGWIGCEVTAEQAIELDTVYGIEHITKE